MAVVGELFNTRTEQVGWWHEPGVCSFWELRQRLGGRVKRQAFVEAVQALLAEGRVIEVWLAMPDMRESPHCLLLPGHSKALKHPVAQGPGAPGRFGPVNPGPRA